MRAVAGATRVDGKFSSNARLVEKILLAYVADIAATGNDQTGFEFTCTRRGGRNLRGAYLADVKFL